MLVPMDFLIFFSLFNNDNSILKPSACFHRTFSRKICYIICIAKKWCAVNVKE